jgi:hypothetical protein
MPAGRLFSSQQLKLQSDALFWLQVPRQTN